MNDLRSKLLLLAGAAGSIIFLFLFFVALAPTPIWVNLPLSILISLGGFIGTLYAFPARLLGSEPTAEIQDESQTLSTLSSKLASLRGEERDTLAKLIDKAATVRARLIERNQTDSWSSYIRPSLTIIARATNDFIGAGAVDETLSATYLAVLQQHSQQLDSLLMRLNLEATQSARQALESYKTSVEELGQLYNVGGTNP